MASGPQKSNVANMLGTVLKDLIANSWSSNSENSSANKKKVVSESFKKNSKRFNSDNDAGVKKVVETLEKLVDAKDEALGEEMNRRKEAEQKVEELRQQLEKFQVAGDTAEDKDQVKSTMMQLVDVLLEEHSSKSKQQWGSDGKRGGMRGRGKGGRGGGPSGRGNNKGKGDEHNQPGSTTKFNNDSNMKPNKDDNNEKVYNKLPFDDAASTCKMQNDGKPQFFPQPPQMNMNSNIGPVPPSFHQGGSFHGAPVYGPGNQFAQPQQSPNQYYMPPQFGPPNFPFHPQNFPFAPPPAFPGQQQFNFPPHPPNIPPQNFGPPVNSDGVVLGGKKLSPQELQDIKQCLKNDKMNTPGHIQNKTNFKKKAQKPKQNKDKEGEKTMGKEKASEKTAGKEKEGETIKGKQGEGEKSDRKQKQDGDNRKQKQDGDNRKQKQDGDNRKQKQDGDKAEKDPKTPSGDAVTEDSENDGGEAQKSQDGSSTGAKKKEPKEEAEKSQDGSSTGAKKKEPKEEAQKSQDGSSTGAKKKEPKEGKKQGKKKDKNKVASGGSSAANPIQLLVRAGIPTEADVRSKNIDMDQPVKDFMLVAKDGDKPISEVPLTVRDMVNFKVKYPNAHVIVIKDQ